MGGRGGMGAHKTSKRGKESGSEGCMCLMSVFPHMAGDYNLEQKALGKPPAW